MSKQNDDFDNLLIKSELDPVFWEAYKKELEEFYSFLPKEVMEAKIQVTHDLMVGKWPDHATQAMADSMDSDDAGEWDVGPPVGKEFW